MSLKAQIKAEIAAAGPMSVADYMMRCLQDPQGGYYATRPAIGEAGDFITAPQVSQMFGELVGLWLIEVWTGLGAPPRVILAEAGPGDGTLMEDVARAVRLSPDFAEACEVWLLETSAPLRRRQAERLSRAWPEARWAGGLDEIPTDAPLLFVANEFLDCLPARQFVRTRTGWAERMVGLSGAGDLCFGLRPAALEASPPAARGQVLERSPAQEAFAVSLAARLAEQTGAALLIDYGQAEPGLGDTLQALVRHRKVDPLAEPGGADLTVHADFPAVLAAARRAGLETGLVNQGAFLRALGIEARAAALASAHPSRAETVARQLQRLVAPDQMGELFKAAAFWRGPAPPGFGRSGDGL
jgi:SAM-dependent MidA family methyltransferase